MPNDNNNLYPNNPLLTPWSELPEQAWRVALPYVSADLTMGEMPQLRTVLTTNVDAATGNYRIAWSLSPLETPSETHRRAVTCLIDAVAGIVYAKYIDIFGESIAKEKLTVEEMRKLLPKLRIATSVGSVTDVKSALWLDCGVDARGYTNSYYLIDFLFADYDATSLKLSFNVSRENSERLRRYARQAAGMAYERWYQQLRQEIEADGIAAEERRARKLLAEAATAALPKSYAPIPATATLSPEGFADFAHDVQRHQLQAAPPIAVKLTEEEAAALAAYNSSYALLTQYQAAARELVKSWVVEGWKVEQVAHDAHDATKLNIALSVPSALASSTSDRVDLSEVLRNAGYIVEPASQPEPAPPPAPEALHDMLRRACAQIEKDYGPKLAALGAGVAVVAESGPVLLQATVYDMDFRGDSSTKTLAKFGLRLYNGFTVAGLNNYFTAVRDAVSSPWQLQAPTESAELLERALQAMIAEWTRMPRDVTFRFGQTEVSCHRRSELYDSELIGCADTWLVTYSGPALPRLPVYLRADRDPKEFEYDLRAGLLSYMGIEESWRVTSTEPASTRTMYGPDLSGEEFELTAEELRTFTAKQRTRDGNDGNGNGNDGA